MQHNTQVLLPLPLPMLIHSPWPGKKTSTIKKSGPEQPKRMHAEKAVKQNKRTLLQKTAFSFSPHFPFRFSSFPSFILYCSSLHEHVPIFGIYLTFFVRLAASVVFFVLIDLLVENSLETHLCVFFVCTGMAVKTYYFCSEPQCSFAL